MVVLEDLKVSAKFLVPFAIAWVLVHVLAGCAGTETELESPARAVSDELVARLEPGSLLVSDAYPDMVDAVPSAWSARFGAPCDVSDLRLVEVSTAGLGVACEASRVTFSGCSVLRWGVIAIDSWMDSDPNYRADVVAHELGHFCSWRQLGDADDHHDEHPEIWDAARGFAISVSTLEHR